MSILIYNEKVFVKGVLNTELTKALEKDKQDAKALIDLGGSLANITKKQLANFLECFFIPVREHPYEKLVLTIYNLLIKVAKQGYFLEDAMRKYFNKDLCSIVDVAFCNERVDLQGNIYFEKKKICRKDTIVDYYPIDKLL